MIACQGISGLTIREYGLAERSHIILLIRADIWIHECLKLAMAVRVM